MADITHGTWIKDGKAVDAVYQSGVKVYGRNLLINTAGDTAPTIATTTSYDAAGRTPKSVGGVTTMSTYSTVGEFFYRFMGPDNYNLYGLTPGETYTLSGSASYTAGELMFRAQYSSNGSGWNNLDYDSYGGNDLRIPVSDGSVFTPFSHTFTIPVGATGVYFSLQNHDYTAGDIFRFKNMKLENGSVATPWTLAPEDVLN